MADSDSEYLYKTACPSCGSSDANAVYDDGHTYCFSCKETGTDESIAVEEDQPKQQRRRPTTGGLLQGTVEALPKRGLDDRTCERYNYQVGTFQGQRCHIAPYYDDVGNMVAQKVRLPGKDFVVLGDIKKALPLFGQHLCRDGGRLMVITEGELDALSVTQAMGLTYPAVSLPSGAGNAKKAIAAAIGWLEKFDKVVFLFDEDAPGRAAIEECVPLLTPGKAFIGRLPLKDANEMVKARRSKDLCDAVWGARPYRPSSILDVSDLMEAALTAPEWGLPWPFVDFTKATYGIRRGALYVWGAGTGSGKTTLMKQLMVTAMCPHLMEDHSALFPMPGPRKVASLFFEEAPAHTLRTLAGMVIGKRVHVPGVEYDTEALELAMREFDGLYFPIRPAERSWEGIKNTIRFLVHSEDVRDFFIDPMTALVATADDERRALDGIMSELAGLAEDLHITIHLVSHLSTPEGKAHEDGGRIQEKHFRGSRAVAYWAHYLFGLERDKQDPKCPTSVRGLKDRLTGDAVGVFCAFTYNRETGLMEWCPIPEDGSPFESETDEDL